MLDQKISRRLRTATWIAAPLAALSVAGACVAKYRNYAHRTITESLRYGDVLEGAAGPDDFEYGFSDLDGIKEVRVYNQNGRNVYSMRRGKTGNLIEEGAVIVGRRHITDRKETVFGYIWAPDNDIKSVIVTDEKGNETEFRLDAPKR